METSGNLKPSVEEHHSDVEYDPIADEESDDSIQTTPKKKRGAWKFFEVIDSELKVATCNLCSQQFSYRSSVSNLAKHLWRKHGLKPKSKTTDVTDTKKQSAAWKYFTEADVKNKLATCKICDRQLSYKTCVSNLMKHVKTKHGIITNASDNEDFTDVEGLQMCQPPNGRRSNIWLYFKVIDDEEHKISCLICKKQLSNSSTSNLKKHLIKRHPEVNLGSNDNSKVLITRDGQLFEIEDSSKEENNDEQSYLDLDSVYIDGYTQPNTKLKQTQKYSFHSESSDEATPKYRNIDIKRNRKRKCKMYENSESGSEREDSLDKFGKYIASLLRQLPKHQSSKLQMEFVNKILTLNTETATPLSDNSYMTVTGNNDYLTVADEVIVEEHD